MEDFHRLTPLPHFPSFFSLSLYVTKCFITWQIVENPPWLSRTLPPSTSRCILSLAPLLPLPPRTLPLRSVPPPVHVPPSSSSSSGLCADELKRGHTGAGSYAAFVQKTSCSSQQITRAPRPLSQSPPSPGGFLPQMSSPEQKAR